MSKRVKLLASVNRLRSPKAIGLLQVSIVAMIFLGCAIQIQAAPTITGILVNGVVSNTGPVGATLTIQGSGFGATIGFSTATLNGIALAGAGVKPTSWSNTSIVAVIPNTASSGPIVVTVASVKSNSWQFTIGGVLTSVSPTTQVAGKAVTITGSGLGTAGGTITFNGQNASWTAWTATSITAIVPPAATVGGIVATVSGIQTNGIPFTPTPYITQLSSANGIAGDTITITGGSFGNQQGNSTVTFAGVTATVNPNGWSNTIISVTVPASAVQLVNIVVTVNGSASSKVAFTYNLPQITGISLPSGPPQVGFIITGNNFGPNDNLVNTFVTLGGQILPTLSWSNTEIVVQVPAGFPQGNNLPLVVTYAGLASTNNVQFSVVPPFGCN